MLHILYFILAFRLRIYARWKSGCQSNHRAGFSDLDIQYYQRCYQWHTRTDSYRRRLAANGNCYLEYRWDRERDDCFEWTFCHVSSSGYDDFLSHNSGYIE